MICLFKLKIHQIPETLKFMPGENVLDKGTDAFFCFRGCKNI